MTDRSLIVIVPVALRDQAVAMAAALGYAIDPTFPLSADGGETVTHLALHAAAGPVMCAILAGVGLEEPEATEGVALAYEALAAAGYSPEDVAGFQGAIIASVKEFEGTSGLARLGEVCGANGLQPSNEANPD